MVVWMEWNGNVLCIQGSKLKCTNVTVSNNNNSSFRRDLRRQLSIIGELNRDFNIPIIGAAEAPEPVNDNKFARSLKLIPFCWMHFEDRSNRKTKARLHCGPWTKRNGWLLFHSTWTNIRRIEKDPSSTSSSSSALYISGVPKFNSHLWSLSVYHQRNPKIKGQ